MTLFSENQALLMEHTLGSTLASLVKAQALAASQAAEIIRTVGFEEDEKTHTLRPRTFEFEFSRSDVDPASGSVQQREMTATVPLLSIINLPMIAIDEARVEMELKIVAHEPVEAPSSTSALAKAAAPANLPAASGAQKLYTVPARRLQTSGASNGGSVDATGNVKVAITVKRLATDGLDRLASLLDGSYQEHQNGGS